MKRSLQQRQPSFFSIFMRWVYLLNVGMWNLLTPFFFSIPFFGVVCCSSRSMVCVKSQCVCCDWEPDFEKWDLYYILFIFFLLQFPPLFASLLYSIVIKSTIPPYTRWIIEILVYAMYIVLFCSSKPFRFITFLQLHLKKDKGWNWKGYIGKKSKQGDIHMFALRNWIFAGICNDPCRSFNNILLVWKINKYEY